MKKVLGSLIVAILLIAVATSCAKEGVKVEWPDYSKWTKESREFLVQPFNPVEDYGVPYLTAVQLNLGELRYYYDDAQNPTMRVSELIVVGKLVGRSLERRSEGNPVIQQLLVDGKWVNVVGEVFEVHLVDAKALFTKGEMKGAVLKMESVDGKLLQVKVTP